MDKTLITVDVPNVVSVGIILVFVLVLYALVVQYALKWIGPSATANNSGKF